MTLSIFIYVRNRGRGGFGDWVCPGCVAGSWPGYILLYLKSPRRDHSASRRLAQRKQAPLCGNVPRRPDSWGAGGGRLAARALHPSVWCHV